jgi:Protein of unknown function (DUF3223)
VGEAKKRPLSPKYTLAGRGFPTKLAIQKEVQRIFNSYQPGDRLNSVDKAFALDLFDWHPSISQKIGVGIADIKIQMIGNYKAFLIVRIDGSTTDISYRVCLNPKLADAQVKFQEACRTAIIYQKQNFKNAVYGANHVRLCPVTQKWLTKDETHVDHYPISFIDLVDRFVAECGIDVTSVMFSGHDDNEYTTRFADPTLDRKWADWHEQHATLRVICKNANLSLGAHRQAS